MFCLRGAVLVAAYLILVILSPLWLVPWVLYIALSSDPGAE